MRTLTPGPELNASLALALGSGQPSLRVVAARAIGAMALHDPLLDAALRDALARETNAGVAAEIVRALLSLETPDDAQVARAYLDRAGPLAVRVMAAASATTSSRELVTQLPVYAARLGDRALSWLGPVLVNAAGRDPTARQDLLSGALSIASDETWPGFVTNLSMGPDAADVAVLIAALQSPRPAIREATVWRIVELMASGAPVAPALATAAAPDPASPSVTWERFGRELIDRTVNRSPAIDRADLIAQRADRDLPIRVDGSILTKNERTTLERRLGDRAKQVIALRTMNAAVEQYPTRPEAQKIPALRTATSLWPGFLGDLLSASGCKPRGSNAGAMLLIYNRSGRVDKAEIDGRQLSGGCVVALNVIAHLTVRDDTGRALPANRETILLWPLADVVACADDFDPANETPPSPPIGNGDIQAPRKVKDVKPVYPADAQSARAQGLVLVEAVVGKSGCVRNASIARSVYPSLDVAALRAVQQWRFEPALLNGKPLEVLLTVTVNFSLS
jgi:TonB family protein